MFQYTIISYWIKKIFVTLSKKKETMDIKTISNGFWQCIRSASGMGTSTGTNQRQY